MSTFSAHVPVKSPLNLYFISTQKFFREKILCLTSAAGILSDQTTIMNSCFSFPLFYVVFVFRINSCPNNCSEHGKCTTSVSVPSRVYCECDKYWKGEACDIPYCKANCGSPDHGYCDLTGEKLCVCNDSWQGKVLLYGIKLIFTKGLLLMHPI